MDVIQQLALELKEQEARADELESSDPFRSVFSINGNPIMPPLMTPERRLEMQKLREAAKRIEGQLHTNQMNYSFSPTAKRCTYPRRRMDDGCCQLVDASTNTEAVLKLDTKLTVQPLIVMGRFKQTLQMTDPLIFDNERNTIMKFIKHTDIEHPKVLQWQLLLEQCLWMKQQSAVIKEQAAQFALLTDEIAKQTDRETATEYEDEFKSEVTVKEEIFKEQPNKNELFKEPTTDVSILKNISPKANKKQNIKSPQHKLCRFPTIPLIGSKDESHSLPRLERLHPQLWKRYHSYPYSEKCQPTDCATPISPSGDAGLPINSPMMTPAAASITGSMSKIQIKQRMVPEDQQTPAVSKLKSKTTNGSQQKLNSLKSNRKTPRVASGTAKYTAHASSHANVEGGMSCTQRRLSYDPRASLKKAATNQQQLQQQVQPATANGDGNNAVLVKRKLLDELEQQQRQRFQQLVSRQAEEQQRMQQDFQAQQQLLMDKMISDMSTYGYDKLEPEPSIDSDSSSITSLPQSRLELEVDVAAAGDVDDK